ncbi:MAG: HEAT repeat domain-containing protein [Desulfobulbaceae bacterium]|nr:MAG: HEAT repeat domain-containing protein [Desulfobulbaceae bacterium]
MNQVSDGELKKVIADFLEMGHVENIIAMFRREPLYYNWVGEILDDERFSVRLGISVLFEELKRLQPERLVLAIPSLTRVLTHESSLLRGEAVGLLGIIGTHEAIELVQAMRGDPNPQVREMVEMILEDYP